LCVEHRDAADAQALIEWTRRVLGVDVEALVRDTGGGR
jgi:hypothetical protein